MLVYGSYIQVPNLVARWWRFLTVIWWHMNLCTVAHLWSGNIFSYDKLWGPSQRVVTLFEPLPYQFFKQVNLISAILSRNVALTKQVPFFLPPAQSMPWLNLLPISFIFSMHLFFPWMRTWSGISAKLCLLWAAFVMCKKNKVEDERPTSTSFNRSELKWALVEVFPHPDKIYMIIQVKYAFRCFPF